MNKQAKIIIGILSFIIIVLIVLLIKFNFKKDNCNKCNIKESNKTTDTNTNYKEAIGIYHNYNWNNHEATLTLNKDKTCQYPTGTTQCKWDLSDDKIIIYLYGSEKAFTNKEALEEAEKGTNGDIHVAMITNNGVILHDHLFNKLN